MRMDASSDGDEAAASKNSRELPADLPRSLNDRRQVLSYEGEAEMYDGWHGATTRRASARNVERNLTK